MPPIQLLFLLTAAVTALVLLSRRLAVPYPIVLVLGGLLLGFLPHVPSIDLRPEAVFLIFLPPLLFVDSLNTSWRDFRYNLRPILLLAIGLVTTTAGAVAVVAHALIPNLTWPAAFVLGAVVSPTDPVATEAIAERLHLPRRIVTILKGESLVNDATGIVLYRIALGALLGDGFFLGRAVGSFALVSLGGIAVGLTMGWLVGRIRRALPQDPPVENTVSLLTPLTAYLPAEWLHVSGVLSVVACGIYLGRVGPRVVSSQTRLQAIAMWQMVTFLLNGLLFLLVGLQLRRIVENLPAGYSFRGLLLTALLISLTVVIARIIWVFPATYGPRLIPAIRRHDPFPSWRPVTIIAWSGMRGGISLAVAAAIPRTLGEGASATPFPARDEILFITFGVILFTLVVQGLSLPPLIRALRVVRGPEELEEEARARSHVLQAGMERLTALAEDETYPAHLHQEFRRLYAMRHKNLNFPREADNATLPGADGESSVAQEGPNEHAEAYVRLKRELIAAERAAIIALRDDGKITDETMRRVLFDVDLDETRLLSLDTQLPQTAA